MGGPGSGNRWRYGVKATTDDYRILDVRHLARKGALRPGYWGSWEWMRDGETVASIQMRAEQDRVVLVYRHRSGGGQWKDEQYPVRIAHGPHAGMFDRHDILPVRTAQIGSRDFGLWRPRATHRSSPEAVNGANFAQWSANLP